jgi:hypothetical protein
MGSGFAYCPFGRDETEDGREGTVEDRGRMGARKVMIIFKGLRLGGVITMVVLMRLTSLPIQHSGTRFLLLIGSGISMGPILVLSKFPFGSTLSERI